MQIFIPIIVLFALSLSIFLVFKCNAIESIFISVCSCVVFMLTFTYFSKLSIALIIFCIVIILFLIFALLLSVKEKTLYKKLKAFFLNPPLIAFLIAVITYIVFIRDNHIYTWDDFSHWGLAVKSIYVFDGLNITPGILQPQTLGMPMFNAFIVSLAGYSEGYMLCGMYFVYWSAILLPVSDFKWTRVRSLIIYSLIMYAILIYISHQTRPNLYNDANLAVISGSLAAYLYMRKDFSKQNNLIFIAAIMLLPHIKNVVGIVFAIFVLAIWIYFEAVNCKKSKKDKIKTFVAALSCFVISIIICVLTKNIAGGGSFSVEEAWCDPVGSVMGAFISPIGLILIFACAASLIVSIFSKKKAFLRKVFFVLFVSSVAILIAYTYLKLDEGTKILINAFLKNLLVLKINDVYVYKIVAVLVILYFIVGKLLVAEAEKRNYLVLSLHFLAHCILYIAIMILAYSSFPYDRALSSSSLDRYILSFIFYIIIAVTAILLSDINILKEKKMIMPFSLIYLCAIIATIYPQPLTLFNYEKDVIYNYTYNYEAEQYGNFIKSHTEIEDKIYIVTQGDSGHLKFLMKYASVPSYIDAEYFSLGTPKYEGDTWSVELSAEELASILISENYTHLFLYNTDEYFEDNYYALFNDSDLIGEGCLYKISTKDNEVSLEMVE